MVAIEAFILRLIQGKEVPWNQIVFNLIESPADDERGTRTLIAGSGTPQAPESKAGEIDISTLGAGFRAHWLGLLGFGAVIAVIVN